MSYVDEKLADLLRVCGNVRDWVLAQDEDRIPEEFSGFVEALDAMEVPTTEGTTAVPVVCNVCSGLYVVVCDANKYEKWRNGDGLIQDLLPELNADQREILISGTCGACFDIMFPPEGPICDNEDLTGS